MIDMTRHIHESNLIENIDDPQADQDSLNAWYFLRHQPALTHVIICAVQKFITSHQDDLTPLETGYYRDMAKTNVYIGGKAAPMWHMIEPLMSNWLLDYETMSPLKAHIMFEHIHPFADGNGRTGRMLMWWQEIRSGHEPTLIKFSERDKYYENFS